MRDFFANHFLPQLPPDIEIVPVSRTIGQGRVVDELIIRFTHSIRMDWLLPGIPPTGKRVEVPFVAIIQFKGDKIAHEHLYWDQASLLASRARWRDRGPRAEPHSTDERAHPSRVEQDW